MAKTNQPENLITRLRDAERRIAALERGSTLNGSVVSQGSFEVRDDAGRTIFRVGRIPLSGGGYVHGIVGFRSDGSVQLWSWDDGSGNGYTSLWDESGNIVMSTDTVSGQGLATPYIPYRSLPYSEVTTPPQSTTSGSFTALHRIYGQKQHPILRVHLLTQSDASTTGEVRLAVSGVQIGSTLTVPASDNTYRTVDAPVTGNHFAFLTVDVDARRTSGAGAIRVAVAFAEGKQS